MLVDTRLGIAPELENPIDSVTGHTAMIACGRIKTKDLEIAYETARFNTSLKTAMGLVVELGDALGHHEWVMVRHTAHASPKHNVLGLG